MIPKTFKILHADDSLLELRQVEKDLLAYNTNHFSFQVTSCRNRRECEEALANESDFDLALIDIHLGEQSGVEFASTLRWNRPDLVVVLRSSDSHQGLAAAEVGVHDYVPKKLSSQALAERLLFNIFSVRGEHPGGGDHAGKAVGNTIDNIRAQLPAIQQSAVTSVHITGETGTGKEVVARLFNPSVSIDCGALPENIVESELFGHKRGSFTGAISDSQGLLDVTDGRWIFLDEIGNISLKVQAALLRAIGEREIRPVGSRQTKKVNFKLITATNEDLAQKIAEGKFRADLYHRLTEFEIPLRPLRERKEEIPQLVRYFAETLPGGPYTVEEPALEVLAQCEWDQGNIRELRRTLVAMTVAQQKGGVLTYRSIPQTILTAYAQARGREDLPQEGEAQIALEYSGVEKWEDMANVCLSKMLRRICVHRPYSFRELAPIVGVQRTTLSRKVQEMLEQGILNEEEVNRLFKRSVAERKEAHVH